MFQSQALNIDAASISGCCTLDPRLFSWCARCDTAYDVKLIDEDVGAKNLLLEVSIQPLRQRKVRRRAAVLALQPLRFSIYSQGLRLGGSGQEYLNGWHQGRGIRYAKDLGG